MHSTLRYPHHYPYQPTSNLHDLRGHSTSLTPRERYLASLAEAKAAEADFIASEAERYKREEEELYLRRRLEELQAEKRFSHHHDYPSRASSFEDYPIGHRHHSHHFEDFDRTSYHQRSSYHELSQDRLTTLRRELEEEELRIARQRKQEREREALRAKELREAERLALLRKAEENRLELIRRQQEQEARKLLEIRLAQQQEVERRRAVVSERHGLRRPAVRFAVDSTPKPRECTRRTSCHPEKNGEDVKNAQEVLQFLFGSQEAARTPKAAPQEKKSKEAPRDSTEDFLKLLFGGNAYPERPSAVPPAAGPSAPKATRQQEPSKPTSAPGATPKATTSDDFNVKAAEEFWKTLFGQAGAPVSSEHGKHAATPQDFFKMFFDAPPASEKKPAAESSTSAQAPAQQVPNSSTAPQRPASPSTTLKEQLESRLNNDEAIEIRDTIQAILASLSDAATYASAGSSKSAPGPSTSSASPSDSKGKGKGKGKAESSSTSHAEPTSNDVIKSMDTVHNIEAAFRALQQDFVFPTRLDFTPTPSAATSPVSSDTESSTPSITKLAYTSRNHPIRYYEQSLSGLLTQLDGVESFGNVEVRTMRKEVVARVEGALDELEREVEGRWKARVAKQEKVNADSEFVVLNQLVTVGATEEATSAPVVTDNASEESHTTPSAAPVEEEKVTADAQPIVVDVEQKETEITLAGTEDNEDLYAEESQPVLSERNHEGDLVSGPSEVHQDSPVPKGPSPAEPSSTSDTEVPAEAHSDESSTTSPNVYPLTSSTPDTEAPLSDPLSLSYPPVTSVHPPTSGSSSAAASVATIRPYELDIETASTSSEEEDGDSEKGKGVESDSDGFLLEEASLEETKKERKAKVQEEVGSDWSEVEA